MKKVFLMITILMLTLSVFAQTPATISAWTIQPTILPTGYETQMAGAALIGDYLYIMGGNNNTDGDTAKCWKLFLEQYTGVLTQGVAATDLPTRDNFAYLNEGVAATADSIYITGGGYNSGSGAGPNRNNTTFIKAIGPEGALAGAWTVSTAFPSPYDPELGGTAITENGYLVTFGGDSQSGSPVTYNSCYLAKIKPDGTLDAWLTGSTLPNAAWFAAACSVGDYVIAHLGILDGMTNTNCTDKLYVAKVNSNGTMTAWTEQANKFSSARYNVALIAVNNTIFAIGGRISGNPPMDNVDRATFDTGTGTLGAWTSTDAVLPTTLRYHAAVYSPKSKSIYVVSLRTPAGFMGEAYISSPLFTRPVPTPTPIPLGVEQKWHLFE